MRFDCFLFKNGYFDSRNKALESILRNEVWVNGKILNKPSFEIKENTEYKIEIIRDESFVSVGGFKLNKALKDFAFDVKDYVVADVGASTGGFTDVLLKRGAKKVYSVDLNDGLLHYSLKQDKRVNPIVKNAKLLTKEDFSEELNLICADLSFISATQVLKVFFDILPQDGYCILLVKPQFEIGKKTKLKNGIIHDDKLRLSCLTGVFDFAVGCGFTPLKITTAPENKNKNLEYLILLQKNKGIIHSIDEIFIH